MRPRSRTKAFVGAAIVALGIAIPVALALADGSADSPGTTEAATLDEAQALFDPENDPNIVIGPDDDGEGYAAFDVVSPLGELPADVKTISDLRDLAAEKTEQFEKEHPAEAARILEQLADTP